VGRNPRPRPIKRWARAPPSSWPAGIWHLPARRSATRACAWGQRWACGPSPGACQGHATDRGAFSPCFRECPLAGTFKQGRTAGPGWRRRRPARRGERWQCPEASWPGCNGGGGTLLLAHQSLGARGGEGAAKWLQPASVNAQVQGARNSRPRHRPGPRQPRRRGPHRLRPLGWDGGDVGTFANPPIGGRRPPRLE